MHVVQSAGLRNATVVSMKANATTPRKLVVVVTMTIIPEVPQGMETEAVVVTAVRSELHVVPCSSVDRISQWV